MSIVRKIKVGVLSWQFSFVGEIQWMLTKLYAMGGSVGAEAARSAGASSRGGRSDSRSKSESFWWCCDFNKEKGCSQGDPHMVQIYGRQVIVNHVCAKCWIEDNAQHSEESTVCPKKSD